MVANERPKHAYTSIATSIYSLRQSADFFFRFASMRLFYRCLTSNNLSAHETQINDIWVCGAQCSLRKFWAVFFFRCCYAQPLFCLLAQYCHWCGECGLICRSNVMSWNMWCQSRFSIFGSRNRVKMKPNKECFEKKTCKNNNTNGYMWQQVRRGWFILKTLITFNVLVVCAFILLKFSIVPIDIVS